MLIFKEISSNYLPELLAIEFRSNMYAWSAKGLLECYETYCNYGVFLNDKLLAFIMYHVVADEGEIIHLVCDKKEQGNGYAYKLLDFTVKQNMFRNGSKVWYLEVRQSNDRAIKLYKKIGFVEVGQRKNYYQNKEDAILMKLMIEY